VPLFDISSYVTDVPDKSVVLAVEPIGLIVPRKLPTGLGLRLLVIGMIHLAELFLENFDYRCCFLKESEQDGAWQT
jgi:hypothetical protein